LVLPRARRANCLAGNHRPTLGQLGACQWVITPILRLLRRASQSDVTPLSRDATQPLPARRPQPSDIDCETGTLVTTG
jgi:hypothetical protein